MIKISRAVIINSRIGLTSQVLDLLWHQQAEAAPRAETESLMADFAQRTGQVWHEWTSDMKVWRSYPTG